MTQSILRNACQSLMPLEKKKEKEISNWHKVKAAPNLT